MEIPASEVARGSRLPVPDAQAVGLDLVRLCTEPSLRNAADGVWQLDPAGVIVHANGQMAEMLGYPLEQLIGRNGFDFIHPEDMAPAKELWQKRMAGEAAFFEWRLRRRDATCGWFKVSSVPIRTNVGEVFGAIVVFADISKQKRVEGEQNERDSLYRRQTQLLELAHDVIIVRDLEDRILFWNSSAEKAYGYPKAMAVGRVIHELLRTRFPGSPGEVLAEVQRTGTWAGELVHRRSDGTELIADSRWAVQRDEAGAPIAILEINRDITERTRIQAELRGSKERLVAALAASQTGTFIWNIRTNTLEWDAELNRLFGLTGSETAGALPEFFALVHPEDRPRVMAACDRCKRDGADFHEEFRIPLADGSVRWLEDKGKTFFDAQGQPAYMTGACVDVTARKDAEMAIQLNRERFELVREASGVGFWFCDLPFGRLDWDVRVKAHFGLPGDAEVTIDTFYDRLHPEDREPTRQAIERSITTKGSYDVEYRTVGIDGVTRWIRAIGTTRYRPDGQPYRFDGITIDITENIRVRRLLEMRGEELERTVVERTASLRETVAELEKFSYSISHDLRAPLRAMQSFALILQEECERVLPPEGKDYLRRIVVAAERMDRLIQDVLSYSKLTRGDMALQRVDLHSLVRGIVETYPQFHNESDAIQLSGPFPAVLGNEAAITQCVSNLLGNALKFRRPDVRLKVRIWCEQDPKGIRLLVRDNGIGIRPENLERIFALFEQVNPDAGGTGIGLAIVRKAAEKMGAKTGVASEYGAGSTFWIQFARELSEP